MMTKENIFGGKLYDENMQKIWHVELYFAKLATSTPPQFPLHSFQIIHFLFST